MSSSSLASYNILLTNLALRPTTLAIFQQRGFASTAELAKSRNQGGLANLAAELGCDLRQATDYYREVQSCLTMTTTTPSQRCNNSFSSNSNRTTNASGLSRAKSAAQILFDSEPSNSNNPQQQRVVQVRNLVTFCRSIDSLLGGGIALGEVTEIAGTPGCGKTQLAMQLCVDARLPAHFGGVAGETVYIDSDGNFSPERCWSMAEALVEHVRKSASRKTPSPQVPDWFERDTILKGIHVYRALDEAAQTATIMALPQFLQQRANQGCPVKLLVVDSIAFHYRCEPPGGNYMARTRSLATVASLLSDIATSFNLAVVVINQMTTKISTKQPSSSNENANYYNNTQGDSTESHLVPALGESWAHATTTRLIISEPSSSSLSPSFHYANNNNNQQQQDASYHQYRTCELVKSPHRPCGIATFKILECGIRDVDAPDISSRIRKENQPPTSADDDGRGDNSNGNGSEYSSKRVRVQ